MKKIIKIPLIITSTVWGIFLALLLVAYLHFPISNLISNHNALRYHNDCIEHAISTATKIEIKSVDPVGSIDTPPFKYVQISNGETISWLLDKLKLPLRFKTSYRIYHKCGGNIKLTVTSNSDDYEYLISYDHGCGIIPVTGKYEPGFLGLKKDDCMEINKYLQSQGFSKNEIGIE